MPIYEFSEGTSHKFWEIELDRSSITTRWWNVGTLGQSERRDFESPAEAKREYDKRTASKLKKGYRPQEETGPSTPLGVTGNRGLESTILANSDDLGSYLVYADWLQSHGDPRGELISVQHARLSADTPELKKREAQLMKAQGGALFGGLEKLLKKDGGLSVTWRLGFLKDARVARERYASDLDVGATLETLLALPIAAHLDSLSVGLCEEPGEDGTLQPAIDALVRLAGPQTLRSLFLGDFEYPDQSDISSTSVGDLTHLWAAFPKLQSLKLRGAGAELGKIDLPELREFTFESGGLPAGCVKAVSRARWPKLQRLSLWFGDERYGGNAGFDDLQSLLAAKGLPQLEELGLVNCSFISGNIESLARAKVLRQLKRLDLSMGFLTDEDAEALVRHAAAFKHLELDVSHNYLTRRGVWLLQKVARALVSADQQESDTDDDRYVAVGE
jgi:uncharacterized protein (TIGR02996 family)